MNFITHIFLCIGLMPTYMNSMKKESTPDDQPKITISQHTIHSPGKNHFTIYHNETPICTVTLSRKALNMRAAKTVFLIGFSRGKTSKEHREGIESLEESERAHLTTALSALIAKIRTVYHSCQYLIVAPHAPLRQVPTCIEEKTEADIKSCEGTLLRAHNFKYLYTRLLPDWPYRSYSSGRDIYYLNLHHEVKDAPKITFITSKSK